MRDIKAAKNVCFKRELTRKERCRHNLFIAFI